MDEERCVRQVPLMCPTCGCTTFAENGSESQEATITCQSCGRTMTKDDLIHENGETLDAAADEMVQDVLQDIEKKFTRSINVKIG